MITAGGVPRPLVLSLKLGLGLDLDLGEGTIHEIFIKSERLVVKWTGFLNRLINFFHIQYYKSSFLNLNFSGSRHTNKKCILE